MKKTIFYFLIISLLSLNLLKAQTTILIYHEDFESGAPGVTLNTEGAGNNYGINQWVINNKYKGTPVYPDTPDENQTAGGTIFNAPFSTYLHIYDFNAQVNNGISNCNYNPSDSSDRFVQLTNSSNGFCTQGMSNVKIAFFYIGIGTGKAHAELYYSADNGEWIKCWAISGSQTIWKYEVVQNPAFDNKANLRFGFRWVNDSDSPTGNISFGIDDIFIKGDFDNFNINFNLIIDSVNPDPVCQNFISTISFHLTTPICGEGVGQIELSDATGSFYNPTQLEIFRIYNQITNGVLSTKIPANTPPGTCYKLRISYSFSYYALTFVSLPSNCFEVKLCPNTITTLQPVVTKSPDSVCVGSVIDIPFYSTGVFLKGNNYVAELSDSAGNFPAKPNILGKSADQNTYDPAVNPAPGSVSGLVNESNQPIADGCNYYIRVNSTNPASIGKTYGPICIKHCDIETNLKKDLHACLHSCKTSVTGLNTSVNIKIHKYDSTAIYDPELNRFEIEVRDPKDFSLLSSGKLGKVNASNDTTFKVHFPCADSLIYLGLAPGTYYVRIIATNSNHPFNANGTLIHLTIGAPADDIRIFQSPGDSLLCVGDIIFFFTNPGNSDPPMNSKYQWYLNGKTFVNKPTVSILFQNAGTFKLSVQETNYGCKGPLKPNDVTFYVMTTPKADITGPDKVCIGDTVHYEVPFAKAVYYEWKASGGKIIDTANNKLNISFIEENFYELTVNTLNRCGQTVGKKSVIASAHPDAKFTFNSPVCAKEFSVINSTGSSSSPLSYNWNFDGGVTETNPDIPGPYNVSWNKAGEHKVVLTVTKYGCASKDSAIVDVLEKPTASFSFTNQCLISKFAFKDSLQTKISSYLWSFGDNSTDTVQNPSHKYLKAGTYNAGLIVTSANGCKDDTLNAVTLEACLIEVPDIITPNNDGDNDEFAVKGLENYPGSRLLIYNRWGDKIYENDNYGNDWNGGNNSEGVYYYILFLSNEKTLKGNITLIR